MEQMGKVAWKKLNGRDSMVAWSAQHRGGGSVWEYSTGYEQHSVLQLRQERFLDCMSILLMLKKWGSFS